MADIEELIAEVSARGVKFFIKNFAKTFVRFRKVTLYLSYTLFRMINIDFHTLLILFFIFYSYIFRTVTVGSVIERKLDFLLEYFTETIVISSGLISSSRDGRSNGINLKINGNSNNGQSQQHVGAFPAKKRMRI